MLGGSRLKRIFQQHFPPVLQGKLKGLYNAFGRYRVYFIRQKKKSLSHPKIILTAGFLKSNSNDLIKLPDLSKELDADGIEVGPFYGVDADTPDLAEIKTALADIEKRATKKKLAYISIETILRKTIEPKNASGPGRGYILPLKEISSLAVPEPITPRVVSAISMSIILTLSGMGRNI